MVCAGVRRLFCIKALARACLLVGGLFSLCGVVHCSRLPEESPSLSQVIIPMPTPGRHGVVPNDYRCTASHTQLSDGYVVHFEPRADPRLVHHMLLFGCPFTPPSGSWDCKISTALCGGFGDYPQILFAWALNASGLHMPEEVGLKVGPEAAIKFLVVQIHYGNPKGVDLSSASKEAMIVHTTTERQRFVSGIYLLGTGGNLKAGGRERSTYAACKFLGPKTIYPFAFRTHAHSMGKQIVGYVRRGRQNWEVIGTRSPQDPQAFYPVGKHVEVHVNDWLGARCVFNTENAHHDVHMGANTEDEMCNFYIMYYTANDDVDLMSNTCWTKPPSFVRFPISLPPLPSTSSLEEEGGAHSHSDMHGEGHHRENPIVPLPPTSLPKTPPPLPTAPPTTPPTTTTAATVAATVAATTTTTTTTTTTAATTAATTPPKMVLASDWPLNGYSIPPTTIGEITAVAVDSSGAVHVLHRGPVTWDYNSFTLHDVYRYRGNGPITVPTILKFSATGRPNLAWGASLFYLPHGLTIDHTGSFWVTDVAMHQVFKFDSLGSQRPSLVLGRAFVPGAEYNTFCKPCSVAVERSGDFYVADGYCNQRVMKFNGRGDLAEVWEVVVGGLPLFVPHKVILNAMDNILYVADRENGRVLSFSTSEGGRGQVLSSPAQLDGDPYSLGFAGSGGSSRGSDRGAAEWPMHGVFGGVTKGKYMGFTLDKNGKKIGTWGPEEGFLRPHDLAVDSVNGTVYVTEIGPNRIWKFAPSEGIQEDLSEELDTLAHEELPHDHTHMPPLLPPAVPSTPSSRHHSAPPPGNPPPSAPPSDGDDDDTKAMEGSGDANSSAAIDSLINAHQDRDASDKPMVGVNVGIIVAVLAILSLIALVVVGVLKEHRLLRFKGWQLLQASDRDATVGINPNSGTTLRRDQEKEEKKRKKKKRKMTPRKKLQSLLGPSHLGFSRLKTYDSNSEEEEFPVFNRV